MLELNLSVYFYCYVIGFIGNAVIAWRKNSELSLTLAVCCECLAILEGFKLI